MTIRHLEGNVIEALPPEMENDLPGQIPDGQAAFYAAAFRPNPADDPGALAHFNFFVRSTGFSGTVTLLKQPPPDSELFPHWFVVMVRGDEPYKWTIKVGDLICEALSEPENNVAYGLLFVGTMGDGIQYRFSL